jgi:hypothetical protein
LEIVIGNGVHAVSEFWLLITDIWIPEGAIAQLGERLLCKQEVVGSIPSGSTRRRCKSKLQIKLHFQNSFARISIRHARLYVERGRDV